MKDKAFFFFPFLLYYHQYLAQCLAHGFYLEKGGFEEIRIASRKEGREEMKGREGKERKKAFPTLTTHINF